MEWFNKETKQILNQQFNPLTMQPLKVDLTSYTWKQNPFSFAKLKCMFACINLQRQPLHVTKRMIAMQFLILAELKWFPQVLFQTVLSLQVFCHVFTTVLIRSSLAMVDNLSYNVYFLSDATVLDKLEKASRTVKGASFLSQNEEALSTVLYPIKSWLSTSPCSIR